MPQIPASADKIRYIGRMKPKIFIVLCCSLLLSGCCKMPTAQRPALISHIVLIDLVDPADYDECLRDCDELLGTIPSVARYAAGAHLDTARDSVLHDYDLAIYLGFRSEEDLAAYVDHEQHIEAVTKWKDRMDSLRVYDMIDPTK